MSLKVRHRRMAVYDTIQSAGATTVKALAATFGISTFAMYRDVTFLIEKGLVRRIDNTLMVTSKPVHWPVADKPTDETDQAPDAHTCRCPRCGRIHKKRIHWIGRGTPRIFCAACAAYNDENSPIEPTELPPQILGVATGAGKPSL